VLSTDARRKTVASIYDFRGLRTIEDHQALLETAATETLASRTRSRAAESSPRLWLPAPS
jgi:hypothetical protein